MSPEMAAALTDCTLLRRFAIEFAKLADRVAALEKRLTANNAAFNKMVAEVAAEPDVGDPCVNCGHAGTTHSTQGCLMPRCPCGRYQREPAPATAAAALI